MYVRAIPMLAVVVVYLRCAKCPSIADHLSGAKKIQQAIAMPGLVEKYMPEDPAVAALIRDTFTGLYSLADSEVTPPLPSSPNPIRRCVCFEQLESALIGGPPPVLFSRREG